MKSPSNVLIVEAQFYKGISHELIKGAEAQLSKASFTYDSIAVPGVFEIPAAIMVANLENGDELTSSNYKGFIALGCVIRGETDHYEHICRETTRALMDLTVRRSIALGFGILTVENYEQAMKRANCRGTKDAGGKAAISCLRMIELKKFYNKSNNKKNEK